MDVLTFISLRKNVDDMRENLNKMAHSFIIEKFDSQCVTFPNACMHNVTFKNGTSGCYDRDTILCIYQITQRKFPGYEQFIKGCRNVEIDKPVDGNIIMIDSFCHETYPCQHYIIRGTDEEGVNELYDAPTIIKLCEEQGYIMNPAEYAHFSIYKKN